MAKDLTDHQRKIVNRYYEHQDTIRSEKLSDLVAELWLCQDAAKAKKLWGRAQVALMKAGVDATQSADVAGRQDVEAFAALVKQVDSGQPQAPSAKPEWTASNAKSVADGRTIEQMKREKAAAAGTDSLEPENLKRAMNMFKRKLKSIRRDDESRLGGRYVSAGRTSAIVGITPPPEYPAKVWDELARQGRLKKAGSGTYQLP